LPLLPSAQHHSLVFLWNKAQQRDITPNFSHAGASKSPPSFVKVLIKYRRAEHSSSWDFEKSQSILYNVYSKFNIDFVDNNTID